MRIVIILFIIISLCLSGCATAYNPATEREEVVFITTPMEVTLGKNVAMKIAQESTFIKDPQILNRVTQIGEKIVSVCDRKDLKYHFQVIKDKEVNAFAAPGGYIYIHSGLLEKIDSDDELACVIGHEVGHVAARHIAKKLQAQLGYEILMNIALRNASAQQFEQAVSLTFNLISLGYSREDELLSDRLGAKYAYRAGYDPYSMITFLTKLKNMDKGDLGIVFLRSHPYASQRIELMKKEIPVIIEKEKNKLSQQKDPRITRVMCPKCKRIFPASINYCPYDGTRL